MSSMPSQNPLPGLSRFTPREAMESTGRFVPFEPHPDYEAPGFWAAMQAAKRKGFIDLLPANLHIRFGAADPDFDPTREQIMADVDSQDWNFPDEIKGELISDLYNAQSKAVYDAVLSKYVTITRANRDIGEAGVKGFLGAMAFEALNPVNAAPIAAANRVSTLVRAKALMQEGQALTMGIRAKAALAGAGAAVATQAPFSVARVVSDPYENQWAVIHDLALTGVFGTLAGLGPDGRDAAALKMLSDIRKQALAREAELARGMAQMGTPGHVLQMTPDMEGFGGVIGSEPLAPTGPKDIVREPLISAADLEDIPKAAFSKARVSFVSSLDRMPSDLGRKTTYALVHDPIPRSANLPAPQTMYEWVMSNYESTVTRNRSVYDSGFKDWAARNNPRAFGDQGIQSTIYEQAAKAIRRGEDASLDPAVGKMVEHSRGVFKRQLEMMQRMGVTGAEAIPDDPNYLPRVWRLDKIDAMKAQYGKGAIQGLLAESMVSQAAKNGDTLDMAQATKRAKYMFETIVREKQLAGFDSRRQLLIAQPDDIIKKAKEYGIDFTDEEVKQWQSVLGKGEQATGSSPRLKHRADLDETFSMDVVDGNGAAGRLGIEDLLENDALKLTDQYVQHTLGLAAERRMLDLVAKDGKSYSNFDQLLEDVRLEMIEKKGISDPDAINKLDRKYIDPLRQIANVTFGRPMRGDKTWEQVSDVVRAANHLRTSFWMGIAQIPEFVGAVVENTLTSLWQQLPEFKGLFARGADGTLDSRLAAELEAMGGFGTGGYRGNGLHRLEDVEGMLPKAAKGLSKARQQFSKYTLFTFMDDFAQKVSAMTFANKLARGSEAFNQKRLVQLGLSKEMADNIASQIKIYGKKNRRSGLSQINIDDWDDQDAASAYMQAINRNTRRQIQRIGPGDMNAFTAGDRGMSEPLKKMLFQYKNWAIVAWEKQGLQGLSIRDRQFFQSAVASMFVGGLILYGRRYINSLGYQGKDRQKYIEENMSLKAIAKGSVANMAHVSLLANGMDTAGELLGVGPIFAPNTRNSGDRNFITNSLAYDFLFRDLPRAGEAAANLARPDKSFTQSDWRAMWAILPLANAIGLNQMVNRLSYRFPKKQKKASRF